MTLSTQQQMLIEQRLLNDKKSTGAAYAFWFFVGFFGGHRFYLGRTGSAVAQLALTIVGFLTVLIAVGFVLLAIVAIWLLVDVFLIPGMIESDTRDRRSRLHSDYAMMASGG